MQCEVIYREDGKIWCATFSAKINEEGLIRQVFSKQNPNTEIVRVVFDNAIDNLTPELNRTK